MAGWRRRNATRAPSQVPECRAAIALERALVDLKAGKQTPDKVRSLLRGIERKDVERKKATSDAVFPFYRTEAK